MTHPLSISGTALCRRASLRAGPRLATRLVKGRHRILAIRAVDTTSAGLIPRGLGRRRLGVRRRNRGRPLTVDRAKPRLIGRGDLLAALDRAVARKVTIISAPAGSGKTSLLRAWADRPGQPHRLALVQVQRDQHDAQQFWLALLDAIRHATGANSGAELPAATPDFNAPAMAGRVLSELADAHGGVTLVVDDLHELTSPDALARLAGVLAEIRAADLRFSKRETRELLDASGITLSAASVALLHQRTEGWAAGLRLAAISLVDHPDPE